MEKLPLRPNRSNKLCSSVSPVKGGKYKNFLASFLSPAVRKRPAKKKKSDKAEDSLERAESSTSRQCEISELLQDINEPSYSTIENFKNAVPADGNSSTRLSKGSEISASDLGSVKSSPNLNVQGPDFETNLTLKEPIYATVNKQSKEKNRISNICDNTQYLEESGDSTVAESTNRVIEDVDHWMGKEVNHELRWQKRLKTDDVEILLERLKEISEENRLLRKHAQSLLKEKKWKEDTLHAELQLKITELEAETRKEVKSLSDRIQILLKERHVLTDQIDILHQEKKSSQTKYDNLCERTKSMISLELHKKTIEDHEKLLNETKQRHHEEVNKMQQQYYVLEESKNCLLIQEQEMKNRMTSLEKKMLILEDSKQELQQEKSELLQQLEESKLVELEFQNLFSSLLRVTESLAVERDILLNKTSFQDNRQKEIHTTILDYSLHLGRLQEHISISSKEKSIELQKLKTSKSYDYENLKQSYGKQLDILRGKIVNQNNVIIELENEKRKLELQLESICKNAFSVNPKLQEQVKNNFLNL